MGSILRLLFITLTLYEIHRFRSSHVHILAYYHNKNQGQGTCPLVPYNLLYSWHLPLMILIPCTALHTDTSSLYSSKLLLFKRH